MWHCFFFEKNLGSTILLCFQHVGDTPLVSADNSTEFKRISIRGYVLQFQLFKVAIFLLATTINSQSRAQRHTLGTRRKKDRDRRPCHAMHVHQSSDLLAYPQNNNDFLHVGRFETTTKGATSAFAFS